jgi:cytochrome c oxidase subunit 4
MTSTTEAETREVNRSAPASHADEQRKDTSMAPLPADAHGQQHPVKLYLTVWVLLFVLSACSYLVDFFDFHGLVRWSLIVVFMLSKAGLIVAVFMHMAWERLALVYAILIPPLAVVVFMGVMAFEGHYTNFSRVIFFASGP